MKTKRFVATLMAVGLVTGLVACAPASDDGRTNLVIWDTGLIAKDNNDDGTMNEASFLHAAVEIYEEQNPDITITIEQQGGDISTNAAQFEAASIAGNGPDMRVSYAGGPTLSFADFFVDLSDTFDQATFDDMSGWNTVRENYESDGQLLALPYGAGTYFAVFVNHALLESAGMDPNYVPATWEEMLSLGEEYKSATGGDAFIVGNLEGYTGAWVVAALAGGEGGENTFTDMYSGAAPIDGKPMLKAYQAWADFYASGLTNPDAGELGNGDTTARFVQGDAPYYIVGMWEDVNMNEAFGDEVSSFWIPMLEGAKYPSVAAGGPQNAISITNYSSHQEEAKDFLRFLTQPEIQDMYVQKTQIEPSNSRSADPTVIENPLLQAQADSLTETETLVYPFDNIMPQSVIDLFYRLNASVFLGTTSPEDAVAQLQTAFDAAQ